MGRLSGKKAVVTGAAQGLGAAIVDHLAEEGADVAGWDINGDQIRETMDGVAATRGCRTTSAVVDVRDAARVRAAMEESAAFLGGLDICVCNAGILISGDSLDFEVDKWQRVLEVNLVGYFVTAREAARIMVPNKRGSIVQINSKSGKKGSYRN
ncbi:MAG: SDR family NAD(P)-dependent oxidoreductase, partial [Candidatus Hydrogenedentes bacterium]|nr:SDR family NAD(P)-dependent oxidoreductase [Candidatus Hydrogenedentota bacterium]